MLRSGSPPQCSRGSYGQLRLEMEVECLPSISAKNLAASNLMGKQREVLALISHWNESAACVREECSGLNASSLLTPPHPPRISNQFKATTNEKHGTFSAYGPSLHRERREHSHILF